MITIGQVFYVLNSRYLPDSSLSFTAHLGNKYWPIGMGATVILQFLFTLRLRCSGYLTKVVDH